MPLTIYGAVAYGFYVPLILLCWLPYSLAREPGAIA